MKKEKSNSTFSPSKTSENSPSKKIRRSVQLNKIPYSIILYILKFYNYKQPLNFSLYSLFGYFEADSRRKIFLIFSSMELFHYPKYLPLPRNLFRLSTNTTSLQNMFSSNLNDKILMNSLSELLIENTEEDIKDEILKFKSITSLKIRDNRTSQNSVIDKKILIIMKNNKLKNFDFESQLNFDFEKIAKELSSHNLLSLRLDICRLDDDLVNMIQFSSFPKLKYLFIHGHGVTSEGLQPLSGLSQLKTLYLFFLGSGLSKNNQEVIVNNSKDLELLGADEIEVDYILQLTKLKGISLVRCRNFENIRKSTSLEYLQIQSVISQKDFRECLLIPNLKQFRMVKLFERRFIEYEDEDFKNLLFAKNLFNLEIEGVDLSKLTSGVIQYFAKSNLKKIKFQNCKFPKEIVEQLKTVKEIDLQERQLDQ
eukprot:gene4575-7959_t